MTDTNLQLYSQQPNGVTYADSSDPDFTVRFKTTTSGKSLNGVQTTNYATEIIANDSHPVSINGVAAVDALSVRIRASGSIQSMSRLADILSGLAAKVPSWSSENVFVGFQPTTPPINRVT